MNIKPIREDLKEFIKIHDLAKKWIKTKRLFENNLQHPSLKVELLQPRWRGVYSFRLDKKYRALFFISNGETEVFRITKHYKKG